MRLLATIQGASIPLPYGGKPRQIMVDLDLQALQARSQQFQATPSVHQSAERHVAADSAKAIKIGKFHRISPID